MTKLAYCMLLLFVCLIEESFQRSSRDSDSYVAAVLEYNFVSNTTANLQNYLAYIQEAATQNADIVIFPEITLTRGDSIEVSIHGSLKDNPIPAAAPHLYNPILVSLSVAAAASQVYVVANVQELLNCTAGAQGAVGEDCPENKEYLFNTNIVLDRNGAVIDRFRKINLFGEFTRTPALHPDLGVFETDFGVTFGHYICFDLMFQVPAIQVVEKHNITDVIFTTMWFSEMPFLTAIQIQEAYAYAMNVNFLASGASNVRVGSAGSGIFSGKAGALISTMPGIPISRLLISRVPKVPGQVTFKFPGPIYDPPNEADGLLMKQDPSLSAHVSRALVPGFQEFTLSQNEVSCRFRVRMSQRSGDVSRKFYALAHDGSNTYVRRQIGVASCAVVSCKDDDVSSCPYRYNAKEMDIELQELRIEMTSTNIPYNTTLRCDNVVYFPSTLQVDKFPLNPKNYSFTESNHNVRQWIQNGANKILDGGRKRLSLSLLEPQKWLLTFGIWGRVYTRDVNRQYEILEDDHYQYRAAVFDGIRTYDGFASGGTRTCAVISCAGPEMDTCGVRFPTYVANTTAIFEELSIEATVPSPVFNDTLEASDCFYSAITLNTATMPLEPADYTLSEAVQGMNTVYTMTLVKTEAELYTFSVWGRWYDRDGEEPTAPGSSVVHFVNCVLLAPVLWLLVRE